MAVAASRVITGNANDVLAGELVGVLPSVTPSYDVEIRMGTIANMSGRVTLLVNGASILERSVIPAAAAVPRNTLTSGNLARQSDAFSEPRSDGPLAFFNAPAGSRITLNISALGNSDKTFVYVEARENSSAPIHPGVGHIGIQSLAAGGNMLDVLSGTPIGNVPSTSTGWNVSFQIFKVILGSAQIPTTPARDANVSILIGSDQVCENFIIPYRSYWDGMFIEERDTLITTLAEGGDRITMNLFYPSLVTSGELLYRVFANPVL